MKTMRILIPWVLIFSILLAGIPPASGQTPLPNPEGAAGRVVHLDGQTLSPSANAFRGGPDFDSGWISILPGSLKVITHNLGGIPEDYYVDMQQRIGTVEGMNTAYFGGGDFGAAAPGQDNYRVGAYWRNLTATTISVVRRPEDYYAAQVRIRIWKEIGGDYVEPGETPGFRVIDYPGDIHVFNTLSLPYPINEYIVDFTFRDNDAGDADQYGVHGIHKHFYGGKDCGGNSTGECNNNDQAGAYWYNFKEVSQVPLLQGITIFRRPNDKYVREYRLRLIHVPNPTYDSGFQTISTSTALQLAHNTGGSPEDYIVDIQFWNTGSEINQQFFGGNHLGNKAGGVENAIVGAYMDSLTKNNVSIKRNPQDTAAEKVRVRIWNFWTPRMPDFDSDWTNLTAGSAVQVTHNLSIDAYANPPLVDLQFKSTTSGLSQRFVGLNTFGTSPDNGLGANANVGAGWRNLFTNVVILERGAQDIYAPQARVRLWQMPKPDFDSGWYTLSPGASHQFTHNLGGGTTNYLVDLKFYNATIGVNQMGFGGYDTSGDARVGAYWSNLDATYVSVKRREEDTYASQVRLRIWRVAAPDYESAWTPMPANNTPVTFTHNLNFAPLSFMAIMDSYDGDTGGFGVNQTYYGGADLANNARVGAYWSGMTPKQVLITRRNEDPAADLVRMRIWRLEYGLFLPVIKRSP